MTLLHNLETWKRLRKEIVEETGFEVKVWEDLMHISARGRMVAGLMIGRSWLLKYPI
jgi:hypothetical protein